MPQDSLLKIPRTICETKKDIDDAIARFKLKKEQGELKIRKVVDKIVEISFGIFGFALGELTTVLGNLATGMVQALVGAVSGVAGSILQAFFSYILTIISSVSGIFSMVKIPLGAARDNTRKEYSNLLEMQASLLIVSSILQKWLSKFNKVNYAGQMIEVLGILELVGKDLNTVLSGLSSGTNKSFDRGAYNKALKNIDSCIAKSRPKSRLASEVNIKERRDVYEADKYKELSAEVLVWYKVRKKQLSDEYRDGVMRANSAANKPENTSTDNTSKVSDRVGRFVDESWSELEAAARASDDKVKYEAKLTVLNVKREKRLQQARVRARSMAYSDFFGKDSTIKKNLFKSVSDEFSADMEVLREEVEDIAKSWSSAALHYNLSNIMTNRVYDYGAFVSKLINGVIEIIRGVGNLSANPARIAVTGAIAMTEKSLEVGLSAMETASTGSKIRSIEDAKQLENQINALSSVPLSGGLSFIHGAMIATDGLLGASISEELIDIINLDDDLTLENEGFQVFRGRIAKISDWDGKKGVWAVDLLGRARSPYVEFAGSMLGLTAGAAQSLGNFEGDEEFKGAVDESLEVISRLVKHNQEVMSVLYSYNPEPNAAVDGLEKLLKKLGLIELFSLGALGIKALTNIIKAISSGSVELSCEAAYPDLYSDNVEGEEADIAALAKVNSKKDAILVTELIEAQKFIEENATERELLRYQIDNYTSRTTLEDITNLPPNKC